MSGQAGNRGSKCITGVWARDGTAEPASGLFQEEPPHPLAGVHRSYTAQGERSASLLLPALRDILKPKLKSHPETAPRFPRQQHASCSFFPFSPFCFIPYHSFLCSTGTSHLYVSPGGLGVFWGVQLEGTGEDLARGVSTARLGVLLRREMPLGPLQPGPGHPSRPLGRDEGAHTEHWLSVGDAGLQADPALVSRVLWNELQSVSEPLSSWGWC